MARTVVDLDRDASVLDAVDRVRATPEDSDVALVVPVGTPFARSAVFLDVARRMAAPRRIELVTADARARTLAASVRVSAFASLEALERQELDATERLEGARVSALADIPRRGRVPSRLLSSPRRLAGVIGSLALALLLVAAVVVPEATVTVSPATATIGPLDFTIRAGPGGEVAKTDLSATVTRKFTSNASGSRTEDTKATGTVRLQNKQTFDIRIPKGTRFFTAGNTTFQSTDDRTLPRSLIIFPLTITVGQVDVPVEATVAGPSGNVAAATITGSTSPDSYSVSNPNPTSGGDTKKIPIVKQEDYATAQQRAATELHAAADAQLATWRNAPKEGTAVYPKVFVKLSSLTPATDVVGKEIATFDLTATGLATAFAYPANEPTLTALARLRGEARRGYDVDAKTAKIDVSRSDATEGGVITWIIRASGNQLARVDVDGIRRSLTARGTGDVRAILDPFDVKLAGEVRRSPSWWPRLPVLDGRITVVVLPATPAP